MLLGAAASQPASIWSETSPWEVALFAAGIVFTLALLAIFFWITFRAAREDGQGVDPAATGEKPAGPDAPDTKE